MDWRLQVAKQAVVNRIPFADALRRLKRNQLGYEPNPANLESTLDYLTTMKRQLHAMGRSFDGATVLEIGSGWFPTIPIMLAMEGAKKVYMTDLNPHMDAVTFASTLRFLKQKFPAHPGLQAIARLEDLPIEYLAPFEAQRIAEGSLDHVVSRTVLEHIPPETIVDLFRALRPKLKPSGLMLHLVDHSDHLEHTDRSLSKIQFLCWTEQQHRIINRLIGDGSNRLRDHEYPPLFEAAGYRVVFASADVHPATRDQVPNLPLVPPYDRMTPDQLATLSSFYVLAAAR